MTLPKRFVFRRGSNLLVIRLGKTANNKISLDSKTPLIQTYTYSRLQYQYAADGKQGYKGLVAAELTRSNCVDCKFRSGTCYTHKRNQGSGMLSMLRSIARQYDTWYDIPDLSEYCVDTLRDSVERYVRRYTDKVYTRFGSYGEPVFLPIPMVQDLIDMSDSWTGYTHTWSNPLFRAYRLFFMASTDDNDAGLAAVMGWREFNAYSDDVPGYVMCPASEEAGYRSNCAKCGLCSGTAGKGKKSVEIRVH